MASKKRKSVKADSALTILLKNGSQPEARQAALGEQFPSVFSIARSNTTQLLKSDPLLHISEARSLHAKAIAMTATIARQFREQRLTASVRQAVRADHGIKGLVDSPTYTNMFNPDWANHCPPDAIEATTSPIAYLADLYREAQAIEESADQDRALKLATRRPDLAGLMLDHTVLNRVEPTLVLVNEILETSIRSYLDGISLDEKSVDDVLLETRYPFALPYERYQQQINYVLNRKQRLPGDPIRAADPAYPYFKEPGVHSLLSDIALIQDTGLGPVQQGLLIEAPHAAMAQGEADQTSLGLRRINPRSGRIENVLASSATNFFKDNFGTTDSYALADTQTFCLRTGLTTDQLDELLSVGAYTPSLSANVQGEAEVDGSAFGSVYINAGQSPAISIESSEQNGVPVHRLIDCPDERFDRMNRMIRLARWLDLPFDQLDQLLTAAQQAEQQAVNQVRRTVQGDTPATHLISQDTLRALGLFQGMRTRHGVPAEDFAAMLYGLSVHARGKTQSQFDRVFNSQAMFSIPLILDGTPFTVTPTNEVERQKIDHLCAALGMTYEIYRFVARVVEQAWAGESLCWSREVVSAFYRLVKLPRYIGLSTIEALALLELLDDGGSQLVSKLAGVTRIASYYASSNTDTLSVIHALVDCATWLQDSQWTVAQLCNLVLPALTQPVATDAERNLLQQLHSRLGSALITDSSFAQVGAPDSAETLITNESDGAVYASAPVNWFVELQDFIDDGTVSAATRGLVKYLAGENEETFEQALANEVKDILDRLGLPAEELHPKITNMIMRARGAQEALLMEGLGGYLNTSSDLAKALLIWSDGDRYQLLREVLRVFGAGATATVPIGDEVLLVLDALSRRALLCGHLALSPTFVTQYVQHPGWFGLPSTRLSLHALYFLTQYARILRFSEQSEDTLLDYFRLINTLWAGATEGDKRLIRDSAANKLAGFLRWGVRDVLAVAHRLNPDEGVIVNLAEFDVLARMCLLSRQTGLDAYALLALHDLTPTTATDDYRRAAELALSCLTDAPPASPIGEVGQSHSSVITVTPDYLVAQRESDTATYTITLRDFMDQPLSDVTVSWTTDLGELDQSTTVTDERGQASDTLHSGSAMGIAHVVARYGLGETLKAPTVTIDCDENSLDFIDDEFGPLTALANNLEPVYFTVTLVDGYGNKGVDRVVEWGATLGKFTRHETYTDQQGVTKAELRSKPAGESLTLVRYRNGSELGFPIVEFISIPYFQYVRFVATLVVGVETQVTCRLVNLDGSPVVGFTVTWSDDAGGLLDLDSVTDEDGIANAQFLAEETGAVVVKVNAGAPILEKFSEQTIIYPVANIIRYEASSDQFLTGSADPIIFSVWLEVENEAAVRTRVDWSLDEVFVSSTFSDKSGLAKFSSRFQSGEHVVNATVSGTNNSVEFSVVARPLCHFVVSVEGLLDPETPELLGRDQAYTFDVSVMDDDGNPVEGVEYTWGYVGQDPLLAGFNFVKFGEPVISESTSKRFTSRMPASDQGADVHLTLSGSMVRSWQKTYKIGWLYRFLNLAVSRSNESGHSVYYNGRSETRPGVYWGETVEGGQALMIEVPIKSWQLTGTPSAYSGNGAGLKFGFTIGYGLDSTDIAYVNRVTLLDGYMILMAGSAPVRMIQ